MTQFERGFEAGERIAWQERGSFIRDIPPQEISDEWEQGFWAGYTPRSKAWAMRAKSQCVWPERDAAESAREEQAA